MLDCNRRWWCAGVGAAMAVLAGCGGHTVNFGLGDAGESGVIPGEPDAGDGSPAADADGAPNGPVASLLRQNRVDKIDLLFMIDNTSSMADKQAVLAQAVPDLVTRLVDPICINPATGQPTGVRQANGSCAVGEPDFDPVKDIHIGIITSSLGSHGAPGVCDDAIDTQRGRSFPHNDDKAHLVARGIAGSVEMPVPTFNNLGFLNWNPNTMMGQTAASFAAPFATMVTGVGQHGCGYEASLEAVYRFLIEPDPYLAVVADPTQSPPYGLAQLQGTDTVLLRQRADFLRPDSLVAVVMITDENDCSIIDGGLGFYSILQASGAPPSSVLGHGTTPCLTNPNDPCCRNCGQGPQPGCPPMASDPECQAGAWTRDRDPENLRCWNQKRRYGVDFLYPVQRYIDGFRNNQVPNRSGQMVRNPLFDYLGSDCPAGGACSATRDPSLVFLVGIVGVPWQDIAVDPMDLTKGYLTAAQIADQNVWSKIVGDPKASPPIPPTDPHMIESIEPRPGLPPPGSPWNADPINGHEWNIAMATPSPNADLQYACVFPINPTKTCTEAADCDCFSTNPAASQNPLCQGMNGVYSNVQSRAKGYPGTRQLQVLQGLGDQAVVASICPSNASNMAAVDYGYRPAIAALIGRIRAPLRGRCLSRRLPVSADGNVPCEVIEAFFPAPGAVCTCTEPGRFPADPATIPAEVRSQGSCHCALQQLEGMDRTICQTQANPPGNVSSGWCYVDPSQEGNVAECPLVASCPAENRRIIRFVNPDSVPRAGAYVALSCDPKAVPPSGPTSDPCP